MSHTHSPAEWAQMGSLAVALFESCSVVWFLTVDADPADFDPRPMVRRALQTRAGDRLLVEAVNARLLLRDAALTVAALLTLLTINPEHR